MGIRRGLFSVISFLVWTLLFTTHGHASESFRTAEDPLLDKFNQFDWNITKIVSSKVKDNVLLSPISIKLVLALLYEGASGDTASELKESLAIGNDTSVTGKFAKILQSLETSAPGTDLHVGMNVFMDDEATPKQDFAKKIKDAYNATIEKIDFSNSTSAVAKINYWAKFVTRGHIEHLVSEADTKASTVLLLLNAVFFKGLWQFPFLPNNTESGMFYTDPKTTVSVEYMTADFTLNYVESYDLKSEIVRLPYMGEKFAMYIILPSNETTIDEVMGNMTPNAVKSLIYEMMQTPVKLALPKFKFEFASSLAPVLQTLGVKKIFSSEANLLNIAEGPKDLVVSNVIQKAAIEVNEMGTKASAVTAAELVNKFGMHSVTLNVSRPFLFFIEDEKSRTVIFVGKVMNPVSPGKAKVSAAQPNPAPPAEEKPILSSSPAQNPSPVQNSIGGLSNKVKLPEPPLDPFYYFDVHLAKGIGETEKDNWVSSPASIKSTIGLLLEAAAGNTATELCQTLRLSTDVSVARDRMHQFQEKLVEPANGIDVKIGNRVMVRHGLGVKGKFKERADKFFKAGTSTFNASDPWKVSHDLNTWVSHQTNNYIPEIISPGDISRDTLLLLVSAVYFNGDWKHPFNPHSTHLNCFYNPTCKKVSMMSTSGVFKTGEVPHLNANVIELPYVNPRYSLVIVLPKEKNGLNRLIMDLPFNPIINILDNFPSFDIDVTMPRFSINTGFELVPILQKYFGLNEVFTEKADLSELIHGSGKVSSFLHRAKIEVNEKGTKAGAASVISVQPLSSSYKPKFEVDHPFFFFIRDAEAGFLFEGQVVNPNSAERTPKYLSRRI